MSWMYATLLTFLAVLLALNSSPEAEAAAAVSSTRNAKSPAGSLRRIFMKETDASNFFRKRSRRAVKSQDEINAEQWQVLAVDERKREFHEKRNEFENYAEEDHDEQDERTSVSTEQWREFHYDGMNPPHENNRHTV